MARTKRPVRKLDTIWRCPDDLWNQVIQPIFNDLDPPAGTGRPRIDQRQALDGMIYQLRTGCQWEAVPAAFGDGGSIHRTMQRWIAKGVLEEIWSVLIGACSGLDDVDWTWQSADCFLGKARKGGITWAKTPRIAAKTARSAPSWSMAAATL